MSKIIDRYISTCCKSFVLYEGITCKCSSCGKEITKIKDTPLIIGVKFNGDSITNTSADSINNYKQVCKRFAIDPTYEIIDKKCPKCKTNVRITKSPQGQYIYICSNAKCREVFDA